MKKGLLLPVFASAVLAAPGAHAASVDLIAMGSLTGTNDLSTATSYALENGQAGNTLGGIGSGLAWAGGNTFLALPDRGPNALSYNSAVDNTTSYISRFQSVTLSLASSGGGPLPYTLTPTLTATTLLSSATPLVYGSGAGLGVGPGAPALNTAGTYYFTGRSDNYDPAQNSLNPNNGRLDPEAVRVSADGKSVFISDEYGPYIYQFDRATGQRLKAFALPTEFAVSNLSPVGNTEIGSNTAGRVANKGMEGLAISPDGTKLIGIMQSSLLQDGGDGARVNRIVTVDIATGATHEYAYDNQIGTKTYGISEILAVNDHEFLVLERDGKGLGDGSNAVVKQVYKIDINGATDVSGMSGQANLLPYAVGKTMVLDMKAVLNAHGITDPNIPAKLEGMAFGEDVMVNGQLVHTLYVANDNDFNPAVSGANNFYVFGLDGTVLPDYQAQSVAPVPLPGAIWMLGSGLLAVGGFLRKRPRAAASV